MKILLIMFGLVIAASLIPFSYAIDSCMCVAFRLDDIQDYWLNNPQVSAIQEFQNDNASLTIGIIGNYFGADPKIVEYIKSISNSSIIGIANHGWNHEHFAQHLEPSQEYLLEKTNQKINTILGLNASGFIAPYDDINSDTFQALKNVHLGYVSANETSDPPPYYLKNQTLYRFPETADTGNVNKQFTAWVNNNHTKTYAETLRSITKYGYAVVMMHPQDFSSKHLLNYTNIVNQTQIHELDLLINQLRHDGYKIVLLGDIHNTSMYQERYPAWLDNVFNWYARGNVTDDDMINNIHYLQQNHLIVITQQVESKYPLHQNITATYFWSGESATKDNQFNDNLSSAWDSKWMVHFGGVDDPNNRNGFYPSGFTPNENPFYFALPYDDISSDGIRKPDSYSVVYWSHEKNWDDSESMLKNRWIKITKGDTSVYAQWEDSGPFDYDDKNYVFGTSPPLNTLNHNAGLDVSPAVRDYIGLYKGLNVVSWQFVDADQVPDGPWKNFVTTSQIFR